MMPPKSYFELLEAAYVRANIIDGLEAALAGVTNQNSIDDGEFGSGRLILYPI